MGNLIRISKKNEFNFHHVQIKKALDNCDIVLLMKTLLFVVTSSDGSIVNHERVVQIMVQAALGKYRRLNDNSTFELMLMIINEYCNLDMPEQALDYLTLLIDHAHDMDPDILHECKLRYNYILFMNGQSERRTLPLYGDLCVTAIDYNNLCEYIRLGHYIHKFDYDDGNSITNLFYNCYEVYASMRMPLFKYFPDMRCVLQHDTRVLDEMYKVFIPYDNAGNIKVIQNIYETMSQDMLTVIPKRYGLEVVSNGKIKYI